MLIAATGVLFGVVALLVAVAAYRQAGLNKAYLVGLGRRLLELTNEYDEFILEYDAQIRILTKDVDLLHSEGQVKSMVTRSVPKLLDDDELTDGLPLQGHTLIVGKSGSGKSNVLMVQIMRRIRAGQEIYCIDTKDEIEPIFGQYVKCVASKDAEKTIRELLQVAEERRQQFKDTTSSTGRPCRNHGEYFKVTGNKMPVIVLIVEELIVLRGMMEEASLIEMLVVCRSAGVFVICLAQMMKATILSREGAANFNCSVWLGKYDRIACGIVFGNLDKSETKLIEEFVGEPGKAAIQENSEITTRTMPEVLDDHLIPYIKQEIKH